MSYKFLLKEKDLVLVKEANLRETVASIFKTMGLSYDSVCQATDVLISADLRGVGSHGVSNMLRKYIRDYQNKKLNPRPEWRIERESGATASMDGDSGLGLVVAQEAMKIAIEKAEQVGIGMVTIRNSGHMGMVSYYPMMALSHNMIGLAMTSSPPEMIPTFGAEARLGTNPIALAAPARSKPPFVFDAATTVVSNNTLGLARRLGVKLPPGWVADHDGTPIMHDIDPQPDVRSGSCLLPLGSTPETSSHKGYGLACVVEILSGLLTGGGYGAMLGRNGYTHCVAAYKVEAFMDTKDFKETMDEWLEILNETKPAAGYDRVLYPGQLEAECESEYKVNGIPLHPEVIDWFRDTCNTFGIRSSV